MIDLGCLARVVSVLVVAWCAGCGTDIPPEPAGERISGTLSYDGTAQLHMSRPTARVVLVTDFPPTASPVGMLNIDRPDFSKPVPYALKWLSPYRYKVVAQLLDLDAPDTDAAMLPAGGYPDFCTLSRSDQGLVDVSKTAPVTDVDITLYDLAGQTDPCTTANSICPLPGQATLNVVVGSSRTPTASDALILALFSSFPSVSPALSRALSGSVVFPQTIMSNSVAPGSYAALYVCLDVGSNSGSGLCTAEDSFILDTTTPLTLVAGHITNLLVDLDSLTITVTSVEDASAHGCS